MDPSPKPTRRRLSKQRILGYACALALGVLATRLLERSPLDDMDAVIAQAAASDGRQLSFHHQRAALNLFPRHGYTLTLDVRSLERYQPGWFFTVTRIKDDYTGEMIFGLGHSGLRVMRGAELTAFQEQTGFSFAALDTLLAEHYQGRATPAQPE